MSKAETQHLEQASHNETFFNFLCENALTSFFDWKVTVTFYSCLHMVRAYLCKSKKDPGGSHHDVLQCISPKPNGFTPKLAFPKEIYGAFEDLYHHSKSARYDGFLSQKGFDELQELHLQDCRENLEIVRKFLEERGLKIKSPKTPPTKEAEATE
ncbi:HEPN domain-containing protein [Pontibacter liquoris]|uniref:HEPN domain-containing protein n=1 Tax=Pontibacter liquoris TaxID=2905677 RepID=UPI001FA6CA73|nr:HEPN domain-containing protein [Pontibacter liquoris]